jgi:hypothetical protein
VPIQRNPSPIRANFTILRNATLEDTRLSWEARGLLAFLLSKPDNWVVNTKHLVSQSPNARTKKVLGILAELEKFGYLIEVQGRDAETGSFQQVTRVVFDTPNDIIPDEPASHFAANGLPASGLPANGERRSLVSTDVEQELNRTRTDFSTLPVPSESGDGGGGAENDTPASKAKKKAKFDLEAESLFEELWSYYPRRVARSAALQSLKTRLRAGASGAEILEGVINYAEVRRGKETEYTLHPATFWGPKERWKDYLNGGEGLKTDKGRPKGFSGIEAFLRRGGE